MISPAYLKSILDYDVITGEFRWRERADRDAAWNGKMSGRRAGTTGGRGGYIGIRINGRRYPAHRLAWMMTHEQPIPPGWQIDHADLDPSNNRISNLRLATQPQNNANSVHKSASGIKGVSWRADRCKWQAHITINKKAINLGYFAAAEEAHHAYLNRAIAQYGEFARGGK